MPRINRRLITLFVGLTVCLLVATSARAADPLVWKFEAGQKFRYRSTATMELAIDLGPGGVQKKTIVHTIDYSWTVDKIEDDGAAVLKQKIDRMRLKISDPAGQAVEFDSRSTDEPQSFAAMIAPAIRELTRAEFTVDMTSRGTVTEVEVPEPVVRAVAASPGAKLLGDLTTAEGFENLIRRSAFELPEALDEGAEWHTSEMIKLADLGDQAISTTYRYEGPKDVDGVSYDAFAPTIEILFSGGDADVRIANQESSGEVLFNRDAGRLESSTLNHKLTLAITQAGKTVNQTIDQTTEMKWLAPDAE
jgi:hypothetical protein